MFAIKERERERESILIFKCEFDGSFSKSLTNSLEGVLFGEAVKETISRNSMF